MSTTSLGFIKFLGDSFSSLLGERGLAFSPLSTMMDQSLDFALILTSSLT